MHRPDATRRNLAELCWLRSVLIALFLATAAWTHIAGLGDLAGATSLWLVTGLFLLINLLTGLRLRADSPVNDDELFLQLLFDLLLLTFLFRGSGGSSNPFVTYYLVPLALAASTLNWRQTGVLCLLTLLAYASLFLLPPEAAAIRWPWLSYQGHLLGMWANFVISALLLVFFLGRMHRRLRAQERDLAEQQRRQLQRDQAVAMGSIAAHAVHELATPLATLGLLVEECRETGDARVSLPALEQQLQRCRDILSRLREQARHPETLPSASLGAHLDNILQPLRVTYPALDFRCDCASAGAQDEGVLLVMPWLFQQVLHNLLRNAAESGAARVDCQVRLNATQLICEIEDDGPGFADAWLDRYAEPAVTSKPDGLGLGLFLARVTLAEMAGTLQLSHAAAGGARVVVALPRHHLDARA